MAAARGEHLVLTKRTDLIECGVSFFQEGWLQEVHTAIFDAQHQKIPVDGFSRYLWSRLSMSGRLNTPL
jgi:hypothetical protein